MATQRPGPAPFPAGCVSESRVPGQDGVSLGLGFRGLSVCGAASSAPTCGGVASRAPPPGSLQRERRRFGKVKWARCARCHSISSLRASADPHREAHTAVSCPGRGSARPPRPLPPARGSRQVQRTPLLPPLHPLGPQPPGEGGACLGTPNLLQRRPTNGPAQVACVRGTGRGDNRRGPRATTVHSRTVPGTP